MADSPHPTRGCPTAVAVCLAVFSLCLPAPTLAGEKPVPKGAKKVERYLPSFRLKVQRAIDAGAKRIYEDQQLDGTWGEPGHIEHMGHTAFPLLTLVKAGTPLDTPYIEKAYAALLAMAPSRTYSVGVYLMALQAKYQPQVDTLDTEVGTARHKRLQPKKTWAKMSKVDRAKVEECVTWLLAAQNASGLWHYTQPANAKVVKHDLSCSQYALLGLRAAMDCGYKIPAEVWQRALQGLVPHQDPTGPEVQLVDQEVRGGYAFESRRKAQARGFYYRALTIEDGKVVKGRGWGNKATGSMTTAGVACFHIVTEGLWRSRKFKGKERKLVRDAVRDGLAWMQAHFSVETNPAVPKREGNPHHYYYLYGLERMGMLTGRRWLGAHDWYKEGADLLLDQQWEDGSWGDTLHSSYAVLFLKRATRPGDAVVTTD